MMDLIVPNPVLGNCDLIIDAVYQGGRSGNAGDDPLGRLLGVSNQGGFRHLGQRGRPRLLVITTSMSEPDWPDHLDPETGTFIYYGDNRRPGLDLHATPRWGNEMLRDLFERAHGGPMERKQVCPVLVFRNTGVYRDTQFLGLVVPGASGLAATQDLVATWHHSAGQRFQNYRATFTVLNVPRISRMWLDEIQENTQPYKSAPDEWTLWSEGGYPAPLRAVPTTVIRSKAQQIPSSTEDRAILDAIYKHFENNPAGFEACACRIAEMLLPGIISTDITRPSRDGGRDAVGKYRIGFGDTAIEVDFALEAKCYAAENAVGIKATSRLISRLRHRQFGVLVTTSFLHSQAYKEIRDDMHPILIVCGSDIVQIVKRSGIGTLSAVKDWLSVGFAKPVEQA